MKPQIYSFLLITISAAIAPPIYAIEAESIPPTPLFKGGNLLSPTPQNTTENNLLSLTPLLKGGAAGGGIWGALAQNRIIQVTNVQLQQTDKGLAVILETPDGESLRAIPVSFGNTFVANIPNARLAPGKTFRQENPVSGIASIAVTQQGTNNIRVTVTGLEDLPKVVISESDRAVSFTLTPLETTAQQPTQLAQPAPPPSETQPEVPPTEDEVRQPIPIEGEEQEIVVTGEQETGYSVPNATTATKTDTPLRDIPQSIQVVPQQVIEDQQATQLNEAVRNVSGVFQTNTFGGSRDAFILRGFSSVGGNNIYRDGFRQSGSTFEETANVEKIEVLKGPASVLFGDMEPGGVINIVTKKPLTEPYYAAELQIGSFSTYRPQIDLSGPLTSDKNLLYRLNAVYESSNGFRDYDRDIERFFIAPVFTWKMGDRTNLTFDFNYLNDERPFDRGITAIGREVADMPYDRIIGEPDDVSRIEEYSAGYLLEHEFNENLRLRNTFRFRSTDTFDYRAENNYDTDSDGNLTRNFRSNDDLEQTYNLQTNLIGKLNTGSIAHTLLFGVDWFRLFTSGGQRRLPEGLTPDINIFDPVYNLIPRPDLIDLTNVVRDETNKSDLIGIYLQDQIALTDNLKLLLSGRFDFLDQTNEDNLEVTSTSQYDEAFSPRIGIVYQPIQPISLYASYSKSFIPNTGSRTFDGTLLEPQRGTQYEVGIRGEFLDNKLTANLAAYEITKTNVATTDPDNPDFSIPTGEVKSKGIELDVVGEILPGWNIIAAYAFTDARVTEDGGSEREGRRLSDVPLHGASLWTTYEIQKGDLQGLGFGAGVFFVGDRVDDFEPFVEVPSYIRTDAAIFYRRDNWKAALNFKNLFDVDYIQSGFYNPGEPFTVLGSFSLEF